MLSGSLACFNPPQKKNKHLGLLTFPRNHIHVLISASPLIVAAAGVYASLYNSQRIYCTVCVHVWLKRVGAALGPEEGGWLAASRVTAPCDVPVIDTEHSAGLLWDPWTWAAVPGSSTGGLKSSAQLMFNPFDLCREVTFPEFLASVSSGRETMNGSTEDS